MGTGRGKQRETGKKNTTKTTFTEGTVIETTAFFSGHFFFPSCSAGSATVFFTKRRAINSCFFLFFFFLQCWTSQIKLIFPLFVFTNLQGYSSSQQWGDFSYWVYGKVLCSTYTICSLRSDLIHTQMFRKGCQHISVTGTIALLLKYANLQIWRDLLAMHFSLIRQLNGKMQNQAVPY